MPLQSEGRVVLKIYDAQRRLMIARPCDSEEVAREWAQDYIDKHTNPHTAGAGVGYTYAVSAMVPRI
jgi:hypothetical protein